MGRLFGTDGIRGRAGQYPLDYQTVFFLGQSLVHLLKVMKPRTIIGWDTRESSPWLARAIAKGIMSAGGEFELAGVLPTSAIAFITQSRHYDAGLVISASHNPYEDNGIKIFQSDGFKLNDALEEELEKLIFERTEAKEKKEEQEKMEKNYAESLVENSLWAEKLTNPVFIDDYLQFLAGHFISGSSSSGLKIVIDCSNGASSRIIPILFEQLGFKVQAINNLPDGRNINAACGALFPESLAQAVQQWQADLGVAYDGDADRAIFVDEKGRILNGDYTLFIQARYLQKKNKLRSPFIIATVMSNLGLEFALSKLGLKLVRTKVGDRYVLEEMLRSSASLGGERSGHTIFLDIFPAGDGLLTSLKMAETMIETGQKLSDLGADLIEFPQVLINVPIIKKIEFSQIPNFESTIRLAREKLGPFGRIEVRYSGTEPLARIMVEGEREELVRQLAEEIAALVKKHLGA